MDCSLIWRVFERIEALAGALSTRADLMAVLEAIMIVRCDRIREVRYRAIRAFEISKQTQLIENEASACIESNCFSLRRGELLIFVACVVASGQL